MGRTEIIAQAHGIAKAAGFSLSNERTAVTGSYYVDALKTEGRRYMSLTIRVADHSRHPYGPEDVGNMVRLHNDAPDFELFQQQIDRAAKTLDR